MLLLNGINNIRYLIPRHGKITDNICQIKSGTLLRLMLSVK
jgi:hypothetical protein